ncbi:MAG: YdeI/OmpD-associated family protein [Acidimicrobiia bacterium]|nr:YdeI/OmpD-associated family protein [Acidimicrobiia bacterium]
MSTVTFSTSIEQFGTNTGIPIPDDALDALGAGRRPAVVADIDGYRVRATLGSMGGRAMLSFSAAHRAASGFDGGRDVTVTLAVDTEPNTPEIPPDLASELSAHPDARAFFEALAPSYQRNFVERIEDAKTAETRARRVAATLQKLQAGEKR